MAPSRNGRRDKGHSAQTTGPVQWAQSSKRTKFGSPLLTVKEDEAHSQIRTEKLTPPVPIGMGWQAASFTTAAMSGQKFGKLSGRTNHQTVFDMNRPVIQPSNHTEMLLKHEFHRGMLISAPLFHEDRDQGESRAPSNNRSIAAHGIVYGKPRYLIVVGLHFDHYVCVPIYKFESKGIAGREHYANEFISVRDGRIPEKRFQNQCDYAELVTDGKGSSIHPLSLAYISDTVSRSYDLNIKCHGSLQPASLIVGSCETAERSGTRLTSQEARFNWEPI